MQIRHLFLTSLIINGSTLASPSIQDGQGPSLNVIELAEQVRVQADRLVEQAEAARAVVEVKHLPLESRPLTFAGQNPDRGYLGIQMTIEDGVMFVSSVMPGSGADEAGLKAGDRILRVNKIMLDEEGAEERLAGLKAGKKAKVTFERDGEEERVTVSLSPLSDLDQAGESRVQVNRLRRVTEAEDGQDRVIEFKLGGQDGEGLPGNIREHIRELISEHGGEGEHQIRMRMERDHEEDGEEHDVRVMHLGDGGGSWVIKGGDSAPKMQGRARVEVFSSEGDGRHMNREMGVDLEGLPEHIRELIEEHRGEADQGSQGFFIIEDDNHQEHDGHDDRDRHDDHDGRETRGKAIIKMLTGDGERTMEFDFDGEDLREMGGRVRQFMGGRGFDLGDVLARVRGDRNDRSGSDSRGLHREEDHDDAGDHDPRGRRQEQDRGMNRPQAFGRGRGMGMTRGRGRGGPEMFRGEDHEDYDDDEDDGKFEELEERIEELEQRIEELEGLLERVRGRRNR